MSVDTIVRSGVVVTAENGAQRQDILIKGGQVVGLVADSQGIDAAEVIDAAGRHILPGGIEPHAHIGIYNPSDGEWYTETCAAACGGITTVLNFFMDKESYLQSLPRELGIAQRQAVVDFAFHLNFLTRQHLEEMDTSAREFGITSFKFTGHYKGYEKMRAGTDTLLDDAMLYQVVRWTGEHPGTVLCVHSQNVEISLHPYMPFDAPHFLKKETEDYRGLDRWERLNPGFTETEYAMKALYLAELARASVYLVHLSSAETVRVLSERYDMPKLNAYGETCAHYLGLTVDSPCGMLAKVNPPVRREVDQDALWRGLVNGTLSTVGTDHCAAKRSQKRLETDDVVQVRLGFPGMATMLPVLISHGYKKRGVSLQRIVEVYSTSAARIFGLYPKKGTIAVGSDADLAIVDLDRSRVASASWIKGVSDYNVFEGETMFGFPERTVVRGKTVYRDGEIQVQGGHGEFLPRHL